VKTGEWLRWVALPAQCVPNPPVLARRCGGRAILPAAGLPAGWTHWKAGRQAGKAAPHSGGPRAVARTGALDQFRQSLSCRAGSTKSWLRSMSSTDRILPSETSGWARSRTYSSENRVPAGWLNSETERRRAAPAQVTTVSKRAGILLSYRTGTLLTSQRSRPAHSTLEPLMMFLFIRLALTMSFRLIESHQVLD
jgi:hypothetical protein